MNTKAVPWVIQHGAESAAVAMGWLPVYSQGTVSGMQLRVTLALWQFYTGAVDSCWAH